MYIPARLIILSCWIIFIGFWAVTAAVTKDVAERERGASRLGYALLMMAGVALLFRGFGRAGHHVVPAVTVSPRQPSASSCQPSDCPCVPIEEQNAPPSPCI